MILLKEDLHTKNIDVLTKDNLSEYKVPNNISFVLKSARRYSYNANNQEELIKTIKLNVANFDIKIFIN